MNDRLKPVYESLSKISNEMIESISVYHHLYAEDIKLYILYSLSSVSTFIAQLINVVYLISKWISSNLLCLNISKTEFIILCLPFDATID